VKTILETHESRAREFERCGAVGAAGFALVQDVLAMPSLPG
jgi:hypothetical protein